MLESEANGLATVGSSWPEVGWRRSNLQNRMSAEKQSTGRLVIKEARM
jgi:hypothetical protein